MRKHFISFAFVLMLLVYLPMQAQAATHKVSDIEGLKKAFRDTDSKVIVNLTEDVTWDGLLRVKTGRSYTINGNGHCLSGISIDVTDGVGIAAKGSISSVSISSDGSIVIDGDKLRDVSASGAGRVTINADIESAVDLIGTALWIQPGADVTVNGSVSSSGEYDDAVTVERGTVTVNGNIISEYDGILVIGGTATVNGDITARGEYVEAVHADYGTVTVNGDITSDYDGVEAIGDSMVKVAGNISGGYLGIWAVEGSTVEVAGNITISERVSDDYAGGTGIHMDNASVVEVEGDVTVGGSDSDEGCGVFIVYDSCENPGSITVKGRVSGNETDIALIKRYDYDGSEDILYPTIAVGAYENMGSNGFNDEEKKKLRDSIVGTEAEPSSQKTEKPTDVEVFYGNESANKYEIYGVQVAASSSLKNCKICVERLREAGYNAYIFQDSKQTTSYRILIGVFEEKDDAETLLEEIHNAPAVRGVKMSSAFIGAAKLNGRGVDTYCDPYY